MMWFLALAAVLLVCALVYSAIQESKRLDTIEAEQKQLKALLERVPNQIKNAIALAETKPHQHGNYEEFNARVGQELKRLTGEFEVMTVRQRSLEKKMIGAERTVNLVFRGNVPVENVPHTVIKEKKTRGAGRGALIPENTI